MPVKIFFAKIFKKKPTPATDPNADNSFWLKPNGQADNLPPGNDWLVQEDEGQLSVDVYETANDIVVKSTIAGLKPENLDITLDNDMITIRGKRSPEDQVPAEDYFYQECYWGNFSRSIILPCEVRANKIKALLKNGILTIILPKIKKPQSINVQVK